MFCYSSGDISCTQEYEVGIVHVTLLSVTSGAKHSAAPAGSPKPACTVAALTL